MECRDLKILAIKSVLVQNGYKLNAAGYYCKIGASGKLVRYRFRSICLDKDILISPRDWHNICSFFVGDLEVKNNQIYCRNTLINQL